MIGKKKPLYQIIHPKRWEIAKCSMATDDSVSRQLQNLIGDARKTSYAHERPSEMLLRGTVFALALGS